MIRKFAEEMEKILDEKFEKYQDRWKETELYGLKDRLNYQFDKLVIFNDMINNPKNKEETKRVLLHISNICLLIFTRLNE